MNKWRNKQVKTLICAFQLAFYFCCTILALPSPTLHCSNRVSLDSAYFTFFQKISIIFMVKFLCGYGQRLKRVYLLLWWDCRLCCYWDLNYVNVAKYIVFLIKTVPFFLPPSFPASLPLSQPPSLSSFFPSFLSSHFIWAKPKVYLKRCWWPACRQGTNHITILSLQLCLEDLGPVRFSMKKIRALVQEEEIDMKVWIQATQWSQNAVPSPLQGTQCHKGVSRSQGTTFWTRVSWMDSPVQ